MYVSRAKLTIFLKLQVGLLWHLHDCQHSAMLLDIGVLSFQTSAIRFIKFPDSSVADTNWVNFILSNIESPKSHLNERLAPFEGNFTGIPIVFQFTNLDSTWQFSRFWLVTNRWAINEVRQVSDCSLHRLRFMHFPVLFKIISNKLGLKEEWNK